jgi:hypothetical protein
MVTGERKYSLNWYIVLRHFTDRFYYLRAIILYASELMILYFRMILSLRFGI